MTIPAGNTQYAVNTQAETFSIPNIFSNIHRNIFPDSYDRPAVSTAASPIPASSSPEYLLFALSILSEYILFSDRCG